MDTRQKRVGRNEALFREVNERIEEVNLGLGSSEDADFICECGYGDCSEPLNLSLHEYELVRRDPTHFLIAPGHEMIDVERVVAGNERFAVVEKLPGIAAQIAVERDPRSEDRPS